MNIRRYYIPNAFVFITQVVDRRIPIFNNDTHIELLRTVLRKVQEYHPFTMKAYVFLPEHFHMIIRPHVPTTFSDIMHSLKPNFTKEYKKVIGVKGSMKFWQKGFWDHVIRDDIDFERHMDYIHYNPVKHGLVTRPEDWAHSSFSHWKERNVYSEGWGYSLPDSIYSYDWAGSE